MVTFIVLYFTGQTLNVFTLGGLALGIGRLVDDSIVELENIQRHLNTKSSRWEAILEAAREVAMPIFASTVTTVVVFLPMFFVVGIARLLLIPLTAHDCDCALHLVFRLPHGDAGALLQIPQAGTGSSSIHAGLVRPRSWIGAAIGMSRWTEATKSRFRWVLGTSPASSSSACCSLFAGSLALVPMIGTEFLPVSDESQFRIVLRAPVGQRVEKTEQQVAEVERVLRDQIPCA